MGDASLEEAVSRIVEAADPERVILFGSAARGDDSLSSDLDFLVVKDGKYDYHRTIAALYRAVAKVDREVDLVLVTPAEVERYRNSPSVVICPAMREGKVVYERAA
jgi:predicted nucleotidyltransferase